MIKLGCLKEMYLSVLVVLSVLVSARAAVLSSEYAHYAALDPKELMKLYWTVDWAKETVSFAVEAATTGWVGFGISSGNGKMVGSDMVIGWVKDSKGYLTDRFADAESLPPLDWQKNYDLTGWEETDSKTVLKFKRKFDTCDPKDRKIEQGTTKVVFAYHTEDPKSENNIKKHTFRGSRSILLLNKLDKKTVDEKGWKQFDVFSYNVTIPKKHTTYWCSLVKIPEIRGKHHITKFEPVVKKGNEGIVHHLVVYTCPGNYNDSHYGSGYDCEDPNMPLRECYGSQNIVAAWGVGGEAFYYPTHTGYPIGTEDSPNNYFLELHYDNPENIEGRKDNSGVRFYYTPHLRDYDAGTMTVGEAFTSYMVIPPQQESWLTKGYCPKECYQKTLESTTLPEKGIKVFASFLHTHLQGRATWTKHVRNGVELPEIVRDDNYDFNFQDIQILRKEVHVKPGDDLIHYCKYQTMDRDKLVMGGIATSQEMCLNFLFYYPKVSNVTLNCVSLQRDPVQDFIRSNIASLNVTSEWSNPLVGANVTWTKEMATDLQRRYNEAETFLAPCLWGKIPGNRLSVPKITRSLPPKESKCDQPAAASTMVTAASRSLFLSLLMVYLMLL